MSGVLNYGIGLTEHGRVTCPSCHPRSEFDTLTTDRFLALRCRGCGLGIESYVRVQQGAYDPDRYAGARDQGAGREASLRWHHDTAVARDRLAQLSGVIPKPGPTLGPVEWVDVGCGAGALLNVAAVAGYATMGVDVRPSRDAVAHRVLGSSEWLQPYGRDPHPAVVSMFDSLEHVTDPALYVHAAARGTEAKGSALVVEAPDLDAADDFTVWKHRRISEQFTEHIWHFSERSLRALVARYAPDLTHTRTARPVAGRVQMVWRRMS